MPRTVAAKLMNSANPKNTGGMHGMLPVHAGMRVRLLDLICVDHAQGLVKDAEGDVVKVVINPKERADVHRAISGAEGRYPTDPLWVLAC